MGKKRSPEKWVKCLPKRIIYTMNTLWKMKNPSIRSKVNNTLCKLGFSNLMRYIRYQLSLGDNNKYKRYI